MKRAAKDSNIESPRSRRRPILGATVVLGLVVGAAVFLPWRDLHPGRIAELYPLGAIRVGGELNKVSRDDIANAIAPHLGGGFFDIDVDRVRDAAQSLAWVSHASVRRVWPDSLQLAVIEHDAVARWARGGLLNDRGDAFSPLASSAPADLPLLGGPVGTEYTVLERYRQLNQIFGPILGRAVELIRSEQDIWRGVFPGGVVLVWDEARWSDLHAFRDVYDTLLKPFSANLAKIDLRYPNGFAVQWKDNQRPLLADSGGQVVRPLLDLTTSPAASNTVNQRGMTQ
ncbi:MAG: FtsQ-type POTRA domain-containing protein [Pseudomonadota bacterium]